MEGPARNGGLPSLLYPCGRAEAKLAVRTKYPPPGGPSGGTEGVPKDIALIAGARFVSRYHPRIVEGMAV